MKVLFIGNSHTYFNDMPETFREQFEYATGEKAEVFMLSYSGRSLIWHSKEYFSIRYNLLYGGYDYCIIQQQAHPFPGYDETVEGLDPILRICRETGTEPVLYMPWAEKRFPENQKKICDTFYKISEEYGCKLARVGDVWERVKNENKDVELFWKDGEHASFVGDYLISIVLVMTISGKTDLEFSTSAHDFTDNGEINWDNLNLRENREKTRAEVDKHISNIIVSSARKVLGK